MTQARFVVLHNANGLRARLTNHGARIVELWAPDRDGNLGDVVLGFDTVDEYVANARLYFGCTVGRLASRVRDARFVLDGVTYALAANDPPNHLHGGAERSFDKRVFDVIDESDREVRFRIVSPDLEEGYPGELEATVTYALTDADELRVTFDASADRRTPIGFTNHAYWNLSSDHAAPLGILDHELWLAGDRYTPEDDGLVPTGEILPVDGTPLDFRTPTSIGERIGALAGPPTLGYDHNFLDGHDGGSETPRLLARLRDPESGRVLEVRATQPALQVYSGARMPDGPAKRGVTYHRHAGLCLEPQEFPNAVNEPRFPTVIVEPHERYEAVQVYRFATDR